MASPPLSAALANAELIVDRAALDTAIAAMAAPIARDYAGEVPVYLTVMHGALPFAGQLSLELGALGLDLEFDYLHATRYRGQTSGGELVWKHRPATALYGRRVLLVDDILDEGYTLAAVREWCMQQGATDVRIAALATKRHTRAIAGISADYVGLEVPDRYVFGFGMDYHEQGRNLPGIYALKD
ncbi:hypoxanthine-guanine phosphoribosyltransferase [Pseudoxanthomonas sacheonensis]|uniref:hypoxanthine-guanine phosphoribosyltransferase n=1 Tax=Pseudoxanthomonas sacheonensis TaxID=443615 RepID=UPI0013D20152|nr:hypoxanthine-guanine phosphoribosyltransferase [Pseudoxanthomonas sacheonensis]KAF1707225.1 hypoxanthine-guanine phosphoribosyltransferase [Pseudoxanthomonas sacheonensis]